MEYKFSTLEKTKAGHLSVIFRTGAGNEIIMPMDRFIRFIPNKNDQPYIQPRQLSLAAARIIQDGHDYYPSSTKRGNARAMKIS